MVACRAGSASASLEDDGSGHDRGRADGNGPREGAHDEGDREEGCHVRQTFHLLALLLAGSIKRPCGALITGDYCLRLYGGQSREPLCPPEHRDNAKPTSHEPDAEGEIRTPEGLTAHQISSLARWTELRYLSPVAIGGGWKYL